MESIIRADFQLKLLNKAILLMITGLFYAANCFAQTAYLNQEQFVQMVSGRFFSLYYPAEKAISLQTPQADLPDQVIFDKDGTWHVNQRKRDLNYWRFTGDSNVLQIESSGKNCFFHTIANMDSSFILMPVDEKDLRCSKWLLVKATLPDKID